MSSARKRAILAIMATDCTFVQSGDQWRGKCIHCRRWLAVGADGAPISQATFEHIVPRAHGGDDNLDGDLSGAISIERVSTRFENTRTI